MTSVEMEHNGPNVPEENMETILMPGTSYLRALGAGVFTRLETASNVVAEERTDVTRPRSF